MSLLEGGLRDQFVGRRGPEVVLDFPLEGQLVAFQGKQEIGLVGDNPIRDLDLAAHGVDGYQSAFELPCPGEVIEKLRDGGDLIGFGSCRVPG